MTYHVIYSLMDDSIHYSEVEADDLDGVWRWTKNELQTQQGDHYIRMIFVVQGSHLNILYQD